MPYTSFYFTHHKHANKTPQVNNYWQDSTGHNFEIAAGSNILAEGNYFQDIATIMESNDSQLFTVPDESASQACSATLGRACEVNGFKNSGEFSSSDTDMLANFEGKNVAAASTFAEAQSSVPGSAGQGKL